jgi:DNA helicase-2/ATP-dependent DNA helicase PcrA
VATDELKPAARKALGGLVQDLDRWREGLASLPHTELGQILLDESGYTAMWQADKSPDAPGRLENLRELIVAMAEFENLGGFLEHVGLVMDNASQADGDMVSIMTLHSAKGLEFDSVFLPGWEEGLFPHQRALDESGQAGLEEERRLAYVGITRARKRAAVSFAANRRIHGQWQSAIPSRFVDELPADMVDAVTDTGLYPGMQAPPGRAASLFDQGPRTGFGGFAKGGSGYGGVGYGRGGAVLDGRGVPVEGQELRRIGGFAVGARVFHQKFGPGTVREVEDNKLTIEFDKAGEKKVMDSFVEKLP